MSLALCFCLLMLTRHTQFSIFQIILLPLVLLIILAAFDYQNLDKFIFTILIYCLGSLLIGAVNGYDFTDMARFFSIIVLSTVALKIRSFRISENLVFAPLVVQCVLIIGISVSLGALQDEGLARLARSTVIENNWGDIYSFNGIYYKTQLIGNALIPFLFIFLLFKGEKTTYQKLMMIIVSMGLIAAGNLSYLIASGVALAVKFKQKLKTPLGVFAVIVLILISSLIVGENNEILTRKFDGDDSSMGVRFDQISTAYDSFAENPYKLLIGAGLGARFPDGKQRNYSENLYIEIQSLYIFYQIGFVGFLLYVLTLIYFLRKRLSSEGRTIFWLYILASLSNPYIFDLNQILVALILSNTHARSQKVVVHAKPLHPA